MGHRTKIDPHLAAECSKYAGGRGWHRIKHMPKSDDVRVSFRSKEKPKKRGPIHELADQMLKEESK